MQKSSPEIDIILDILNKSVEAKPGSVFLNSLLKQYRERGSLSRKQMEGLLGHATKVKEISGARLATLQAIILRKPVRYKSVATIQTAKEQPVSDSATLVSGILEKYPEHKRVLFFKMKLDKSAPLTITEYEELKKFYKLIMK